MFGIGPMELIVIVILALIVLGPERFPAAGQSLGKAMREFRSVADDLTREVKVSLDEPPQSPPSRAPGEMKAGSVRQVPTEGSVALPEHNRPGPT